MSEGNGEHQRLEQKIDAVGVHCHDLYESSARLEGKIEGLDARILSLRDDYRDLTKTIREASQDCKEHRHRTEALEAQMALVSSGSAKKPPSEEARPRTGDRFRAVTQHDLDDTARIVAERAEEAAERTVDERLAALEAQREAKQERTRKSVTWWLEVAKTVIALLVGSGIVFAARCELPARSATDTARLRQVLSAPSPDAAMVQAKGGRL